MHHDTGTAVDHAASIVESYFRAPVTALVDTAEVLSADLGGTRGASPLTASSLDGLVRPHAMSLLALPGVAAYGAGFIAALDLVDGARGHLAWWQGSARTRLVLASQPLGKERIDYSDMEWFRVPLRTGAPHVAGPYVDYLCSDEYTVTISAPVTTTGGVFAGVAALDILVDSIERDLTPRLEQIGRPVTLVNGVGRVVVSTDHRSAAGDSVRGSRLAALPRTACGDVALDVIVG
ncbi:cache domain-containing protein [Microbacterium betulae]|uniref:Cache domain-containing protein n=1 Tax=Microbacterium betulae TaxID=2981139 RepID=A0AA97FKQ1_9MICO|nr:cache domain-containing protein [Microbacterium sp. AB]WOF23242.1 cache domain-containing protein [Microbacterium sp. AB]